MQRVDCRLVDHSVNGTLFLATSHLCFSSLAPLAASAASVAPAGSFSLKRNSLFASGGLAQPNVTLVARLAKVRSMAQGFAKRSRSLVFTLDDNSQVKHHLPPLPSPHPPVLTYDSPSGPAPVRFALPRELCPPRTDARVGKPCRHTYL